MSGHGIPRVSSSTTDKSEAAKEKERQQIASYKNLESDVRERIQARDYSNTTLQLSSQLLTRNPEYYTVWNQRRLILQHVFAEELSSDRTTPTDPTKDPDHLAAARAGLTPAQHEVSLLIKEDLSFLVPLLKTFPKCYWIWNHRSWLLGRASAHLPASHAASLWRGELHLVTQLLAQDSRNFHGWGYRRTVVGQIELLGGSPLAEQELAYTGKMVRAGLSNFSAWHYRATLLPRVLELRGARADERRACFDAEREMLAHALWADARPYDQSAWFYHGFLMGAAMGVGGGGDAVLDLQSTTEAQRREIWGAEVQSLREMLDGAEDNKYIYQGLLECARRYVAIEGDGGSEVDGEEMRGWLETLRTLDPLREGRWRDMGAKMGL